VSEIVDPPGDLTSRLRSHLGWFYLGNAVFCTGIAGLLALLGASEFWPAFVISLSIGLSIQTAFLLLDRALEGRLGASLPAALALGTGVVTGLLIGGAVTLGDPFRLFVASPGSLVLALFFGVLGLLGFVSRARLLVSRLRLAELERARISRERDLAATRLKLLQAQIEPHFLFNTLGNVESLVRTAPEKAEQMLGALTRLLRRSLQRTREDDVRLDQEFELVRAYLDIQAIRMNGRLRYLLDLAPEAAGFPVPPLLLQPLVENAIVHGVERKPGPGTVEVRGAVAEGRLELKVIDDGAGFGGDGSETGTGTALANIRARHHPPWALEAALKLAERPGGGVVATLVIPTGAGP